MLSNNRKFIRSLEEAPILNTPHFTSIFGGKDGHTLELDNKGHLRALEFIALKNTLFKIQEIIPQKNFIIYKVKTPIYPHENLFIDSRFTTFDDPLAVKNKNLPISSQKMLTKLNDLVGTPYVWGGNWSQGIPKMLKLYPPTKAITSEILIKWTMKGVDCSGLLFEITSGFTPRNTSYLQFWGQSIPIRGNTIKEIIKKIRPLDIIVYPQHVIIILDTSTSIESRENQGVITTPLSLRLSELFEQRQPENFPSNSLEYFVIRRWL